jgi:3-deoxy-7-phosphoheptulonate synthase
VFVASSWTPDSWRSRTASQQATYDDPQALAAVLERLRRFPKIVTSWEAEKLKRQLADVARGERFLLQGGDCSERFSDCQPHVLDAKLKVLLMMSAVLTYGGGKPVVRVGRIAGQYAKPRSAPMEVRDGVSLPSYRGDIVNSPEFTPEARRADPQRLMEAYYRSAVTLNFLRSLLAGGFGDLHHPRIWNLSFVEHAEASASYREIVRNIEDGIRFTEAMLGRRLDELGNVDFYTSHEGLHLEYESAVGEVPPLRTGWYNLGTHLPWIGERTRQIDGAHVEFFRGIKNPIGVKVGPSMQPDELIDLARVLDPENEPGRLVIIHRMGVDKVEKHLPTLLEAGKRAGLNVVWCCDPMHGNTYTATNGIKTRKFDHILGELDRAFQVHASVGTHLGGVHFEMTGQDVTEVVGGARGLSEADLVIRYESDVDPRLNYEQAMEMAFLIAGRMREARR